MHTTGSSQDPPGYRESNLSLSHTRRSGPLTHARANSKAERGDEENSRESECNPECTWRAGARNMARPETSWRRLNPHLERDVRELVRQVAGLQDDADPNFQFCLHFAWSNFRCVAWDADQGARAVRFCSFLIPASSRRRVPAIGTTPPNTLVQLPDLSTLNT